MRQKKKTQSYKPIENLILSHREACYKVLRDARKPLHYKDITKKALKYTKTAGRTPENTIYARMITDSKRRFKKLGNGVFALHEWKR